MNSTHTAVGPAIVLTLFLLTSCGSLPSLVKPPVSSRTSTRYCPAPPETAKPPDTETARFFKEVENWQGVPYRYGGIGTAGVDCSGLAVSLYESLYDIELPRTAREQIQTGTPVSPKALMPGDLVFFRFRDRTRHVGIYIGDRRFTHASRKKKGVTISSLDHPFWKSRYRAARRILANPPGQIAPDRKEMHLSSRTRY